MPRTRLGLTSILLITLSPFPITAAEKSFPIANHGDLLLTVPDGWTQTTEKSPLPGIPSTIKFTANAGKFEMLVTPLTSPDNKPDFASPANAKKMAEVQLKRMLPSAREMSATIQELKGDHATGYYYTLTDKAPDPGSFEYLTSAHVAVGDALLTVMMLHHQKDLPARQAGLTMLKTASQKPGPATKPASDIRVSPPGANWELVIPAQGLQIVEDQTIDARKARQLTAASNTGLTISVFMEPAQKPGDSTVVRSVYWTRARQSPIPKSNIRLVKTGDISTAEYTVPDLDQKNMNLYLVHQNTWIDIHISKTTFTPADQPLFDQILKNVKFEPTH
jgi:hypothetical protein